MINTNIRGNESFLVAASDQTTMPSTGSLYDPTTKVVNLNDGQLGLVSDSIFGTEGLNNFCDATAIVAEAPVIAIYQGTQYSANPAASVTKPLWARTFERSAPINGRGPVYVTYQAFQAPTHAVSYVGDIAANPGAINVADETEYAIEVALRGRRIQEMYSREEAASVQASITTPNFTDLGKSTAEGRSWIIHNLLWILNRGSKALNFSSRFPSNQPVVAFAIDTTGANGLEIGGGSPIAEGDTVTVVDSTNGTATLTLTEAMATSIKNAAVAFTGDVIADVTWTIVPIAPESAYETTSLVDSFLVMALDEDLSYVDYIPQVKVDIQVGLTYGFNPLTVSNVKLSNAYEGEGLARQLNLWYEATQGQRKYATRHTQDPVIKFPSPIVDGEEYNTFIIHHGQYTQPHIAGTHFTPFKEIVLVPTSNSTLTSTFTTVLNSWLGSTTHNTAIVNL